ncbi:MAG: hypothetical protein V6Z89_14545 [Desulfobacter sp.]
MSALVTDSQVAESLNIGTKAVQIRASRDDWPAVKKIKQGGSQTFFIRDLLPLQVRQSLAEREQVTPGMPLPQAVHDTPVPKRSARIGMAKYHLVHAFRMAKEQAPWGEKGSAAEAFLLAYNTGALLPKVFATVGKIRQKTLEALDKKLRQHHDDYHALCDGRGGWKKHGSNKYRERKLSEAAKAAFLKCYLHGAGPSVSMAIKSAKQILEKQGTPEYADESTWRRWLKDYEKQNAGVICLARKGMKAYQDRFGPYISRDGSLLDVGQCLVADGKTLNFFIRHPETGRPCRMTLVVFFDWASRYPAGWQIMPTENQISILSAFKNAVDALGRYPDAVYLDNGRAFKSKLFTETDPDFEQMAGLYARVGTAVMFAKPYNGRSKVVERFFRTVQDQLEFMMPSYCGDSITTKPPWMNRNETFHKAWHKARTQNWIPTIREAALIIDRYFHWYARQVHRDLQASPAEIFLANQGPGVDTSQLAHDFLMRKQVHPRNCRVTLWGIDYESDCLHNLSRRHPILAMIDTANLDRIWCYTTDGTFLGEAYPVQACHPLAKQFGDQAALDRVVYQNKRQAKLARNTRQQLAELGITPESGDSLNILPFSAGREKIPVLSSGISGNSGKKEKTVVSHRLSAGEIRRLEQVVEKADRAAEALPEIPRPRYWSSGLEHYEWCFRLVHEHGREPEAADTAFMNAFEALPAFANYRQRFDDLKSIFNE